MVSFRISASVIGWSKVTTPTSLQVPGPEHDTLSGENLYRERVPEHGVERHGEGQVHEPQGGADAEEAEGALGRGADPGQRGAQRGEEFRDVDAGQVNWVNGPLLQLLASRRGYDVRFSPFKQRPGSRVKTLTVQVRD